MYKKGQFSKCYRRQQLDQSVYSGTDTRKSAVGDRHDCRENSDKVN